MYCNGDDFSRITHFVKNHFVEICAYSKKISICGSRNCLVIFTLYNPQRDLLASKLTHFGLSK